MKNKEIKTQEQQSEKNLLIQSVSKSNTPLPPPEWIERFTKVYPDAARCIFETFEKTAEHNRLLALKQTKIVGISQWHGFFATLAIIIGAIICALFDKKEVALALLGISLVGIIEYLIRKS
jgi:uncharacterized membrane protein